MDLEQDCTANGYDQHDRAPLDIPSSPLAQASYRKENTKPRKPPTVTPRSFRRFFTPRSSVKRGRKISASRKALREITGPVTNRVALGGDKKTTDLPFYDIQRDHDAEEDEGFRHGTHTKRLPLSPESSPLIPSPSKRRRLLPQLEDEPSANAGQDSESDISSLLRDDSPEDSPELPALPPLVLPIRRKANTIHSWTLERSVGYSGTTSNKNYSSCFNDWQIETANFYSRPEDVYACTDARSQARALPFCAAGCNTNSLVAIGDEDGGIRLLESAKSSEPPFSKAYLAFEAHNNAILDVQFSYDDLLLATASGDQTVRIIDMQSQSTKALLQGHLSSVKQVRFQPGSSNDVIATSGRDGSVQIWDLRCKGYGGPVKQVHIPLDPQNPGTPKSQPAEVLLARPVNSLYEAHSGRQAWTPTQGSSGRPLITGDTLSKTESPTRRGDVSITALSFLGPGHEHLLVTGSEANASVKLWDIRTTQQRRGKAIPLAVTQVPPSHECYRPFGLTSLTISGDGSRIFTLCRDNTVYAYSTSHFILGHAPELSNSPSTPRRANKEVKQGLAPIYGLRHPKFHATSFYVKTALRPANQDYSEMLPVGSSDGCVVLFPTDERYMRQQMDKGLREPVDTVDSPSMSLRSSRRTLCARQDNNTPIYQHGTALVRGHRKEVTGLTWTADGELISVSDDFTARCWREGSDAKDLRMGGEGEGKRWECGWAEVDPSYDDDDE